MLKKVLFVIAALAGGLVGAQGAWVFHYVVSVDVRYLGQHPWQVRTFGLVMFLALANAIYAFKTHNSRFYGLFVLGIGIGVFLRSISSLPGSCPDACQADFIVQLAVCLILMVDGFSSFYRGFAKPK
jgi:hypothetical protein